MQVRYQAAPHTESGREYNAYSVQRREQVSNLCQFFAQRLQGFIAGAQGKRRQSGVCRGRVIQIVRQCMIVAEICITQLAARTSRFAV